MKVINKLFVNNDYYNIFCYDCASNLLKKRLMFKYAQSKNTDHYDLTRFNRVEARKIKIRFIYINCFNLHVFLFSLILIY